MKVKDRRVGGEQRKNIRNTAGEELGGNNAEPMAKRENLIEMWMWENEDDSDGGG